MTLGEVHEALRLMLKRGTALDAEIPIWVRQAARLIERNHTFQYMKKFYEVSVNLDSERPRVLELPFGTVKSIGFFRWNVEGAFYPLSLVDPLQYTGLETGRPEGYWLSGAEALVLDREPDLAYDAEVLLAVMTSWPTADSARNWLIEMADDLLIAQATMLAGASQRDNGMIARGKGMRDEALRTVLIVDDELTRSNTSSVMQYMGAVG